MVKLSQSIAATMQRRVLCIECGSAEVDSRPPAAYFCDRCGASRPRAVVIDPVVKWWTAADGEYWHQSVGIFLRNSAGAYLVFRRTRFPFGLTIPAGHVHVSEVPAVAARRELQEETALAIDDLQSLDNVDVVGDSCRRGADAHHWNCFLAQVDGYPEVKINEEGVEPSWLQLDGMLRHSEMVPATSFLIKHHRERL